MKRLSVLTVMTIVALTLMSGSAQAALLGISNVLSVPDITSNSTGTYSYDATTDIFSAIATPLSISFDGANPITITGVRSYSVAFEVDSAGNFVGGVPGDDLVIVGDIDVDGDSVNEYSGTLITGEVTDFGWFNIAALDPDGTDLFDFTFDATGGALSSFYVPGVGGGDFITAEQSTFTGSFAVSFGGSKTKHDTSPLVPEPSSMALLGTGLLGLIGRARKKLVA